MAHYNAIVPAVPRHNEMQQQPFRNDHRMFGSSDDTAMMRQVLGTHVPDGRVVNVRPWVHVIDDIFARATPVLPGAVAAHDAQGHALAQLDLSEDKPLHAGLGDMIDLLAYTISKISCEISCKCSGGGDAHNTTIAIFNTLTSYTWDAKVVLALAAFAVIYGEFWLVAQLYPTNPLAKSIAVMKQLPETLERVDMLKPKFEALTNLINAMMEVTKSIIEFQELPPQYISQDTPEMAAATAHIPTAVYWTIRSIVACAAQIMGLIGMGHEYMSSTTEAWELSSLAHKLSSIHGHLRKQLDLCYRLIDEKIHIEAFQTLVRLFETPHIDNIKILKALFFAKDDQLPLYDGTKKTRAGLEFLRRKNVLILISDLDILSEELFILEQIYNESRQLATKSADTHFEVVWLPVVERATMWDDQKQKHFEMLQGTMPWFSVVHPSMVDLAVIRYIKEIWKFNKKPILVVLDPHGKVVNPNALHMVWIWQSAAYPFTSAREEMLWKEESWRIELLMDNVEPRIFNWIGEGKYICLFGGEDTEWIRKFCTTAQAVAREAGIGLEMLYVGKSNPREKVRKNNQLIEREKLAHILPDLTLIWFFWVRIESMWHSKSKLHHQQAQLPETDPILQEIMTMLSFDGSDQGWAVVCGGAAGPHEMAKGKGETMWNSFERFENWRERVPPLGFVNAMKENIHEHQTPHHCNRLILPGANGTIPERVVCAECGRSMEKYIMYRCCTD
ncbi:hypothetical protein QQ045_001068 [Rhodiola kirilowii]